mmetsp:Transcript_23827/g.62394  ORF Transcript_23827/g.62394 Transcript_23827/m.62394 type:complete len:240 (+) Transcript_23827:926-1645(+)
MLQWGLKEICHRCAACDGVADHCAPTQRGGERRGFVGTNGRGPPWTSRLLAAESAHAISMSAHDDHTCAVASQSYRNPSTYLPGARSSGIRSRSTMETAYGKRPEQCPVSFRSRDTVSLHGGANCGAEYLSEYGSGFIAHVEFAGCVPSLRNVPLISSRESSSHSNHVLPENGMGVAWKHASVSADSSGQSRYWYPPPWLALSDQMASTSVPRRQTTPVGEYGSTLEPRSPWMAWEVFR